MGNGGNHTKPLCYWGATVIILGVSSSASFLLLGLLREEEKPHQEPLTEKQETAICEYLGLAAVPFSRSITLKGHNQELSSIQRP